MVCSNSPGFCQEIPGFFPLHAQKRKPGGMIPPGFSTLHISTEKCKRIKPARTLAGFSYQPSTLSPYRPFLRLSFHPATCLPQNTACATASLQDIPSACCSRLQTPPFTLLPHFISPAAPTQYGHSLHVAAAWNGYRKIIKISVMQREKSAKSLQFLHLLPVAGKLLHGLLAKRVGDHIQQHLRRERQVVGAC